MIDPWELRDRATNVESLIITSYVIYRNRDRLKQIATKTAVKLNVMKPPDVVVQMKPANLRVHPHKPFGTIQGCSISNSHATGE